MKYNWVSIKFTLEYLRNCETLRLYNDIKLNWAQVLHDHNIKTSHDMIEYYINNWGFLYQRHGGLLVPVQWNTTQRLEGDDSYGLIKGYADELYNTVNIALLSVKHPEKELHPPALSAAIWQDIKQRFPTVSSMKDLWDKQAPSPNKYYVYMITTTPYFHQEDNRPCFIGFAEDLEATMKEHLRKPMAIMLKYWSAQAQLHGRPIPLDEMFRTVLLDVTNDKFNARDLQLYYARCHDTNVHGFNRLDADIHNNFADRILRRLLRQRRRQ